MYVDSLVFGEVNLNLMSKRKRHYSQYHSLAEQNIVIVRHGLIFDPTKTMKPTTSQFSVAQISYKYEI